MRCLVLTWCTTQILSTDGAQLVGLSLSYAMSITTQLNMMVRMSTETENSFNSVERIKEYCEVPQEAGSVRVAQCAGHVHIG